MSERPVRVAVCTMPTVGHINPLLPVVRALTGQGADVVVTSTPDTAERLAAAGARLVDYPASLPERAEQPASGLPEIMRLLVAATEEAYPWTLEFLVREQPDAVFVDSIVPWGRMAANQLGIPVITSCSTFVVTPDINPSLSSKLDLAKVMVAGTHHLVRYAWNRMRIRHRFNADPGDPATMLGGRGDRTVAYISRALQPLGERVGDDVEFVGSAVRPASPDHPDLADIPDGPLVYISLGTRLNDRPDFLRSCLEAFADHPGPVLLSIGSRTDIAELGTPPANAIIRRWVPQLSVLARADLFVTHAGMNSTVESLVHGVPMLLFPQTADQPRNASRVEELGAGIQLRTSAPTPQQIRAAADRARAPEVRAAAVRLGAGLVEGGGTDRAAEVILEMARDHAATVASPA